MKKVKYTIYTEDTPLLRPLLDRYLPRYTIHLGEGRQNGVPEQAATVTYISDVADITVAKLISHILLDCHQKSVYLETDEIHIKEFTKPKEAA